MPTKKKAKAKGAKAAERVEAEKAGQQDPQWDEESENKELIMRTNQSGGKEVGGYVTNQVCKATKEELKEGGCTVLDDCPLCLDSGARVRVGNHSSNQSTAQAGGGQGNQSGLGGNGQVCHEVQACITNARKSSGYRYSMYKCAEECHAAYCPGGSASSIYYDGDGLDLQIRLLFKSERDAEDFQTKLNSFASEHPHFREKLNVTRRIGRVNITAELERVMRTDYDSGDNADSPEMSLNDVLSHSATVVSLRGDSSHTLQALEDPSVVANFGSKWYRCHLIPNCAEDRLKDDPDNFIYASWPFHQHLDGLHTTSGIGLTISLDYSTPSIAEEVMVNNSYEERHRVVVIVHFEAVEVANIFQAMLKAGTTRIDDTCFKSFVHVRSVENFSKCISKKLRDQKKKSPWVAGLGLI